MFKDGMVSMIQKAKKMQEDMKIAQEEIKSTFCQGESGSGAVKITMTGEYRVTNIEIDESLLTDKETLEIAQMVLVGKVNTDIVSSINVHSPIAVGLSGGDSNLIEASQRDSSLGYVGDVVKINPSILECLMEENLIPVISTIGTDSNGQAYNINSDTVAAALAGSLKAERLLYLTDIEGLLEDVSDPASKISKIGISSLNDLIEKGIVKSGMIPKAQACIDAIKEGVASAHMVDGRIPHVLLLELFTDAGIGTMVLPEDMLDSFKPETQAQDQS